MKKTGFGLILFGGTWLATDVLIFLLGVPSKLDILKMVLDMMGAIPIFNNQLSQTVLQDGYNALFIISIGSVIIPIILIVAGIYLLREE